jgi:hypothetical protein
VVTGGTIDNSSGIAGQPAFSTQLRVVMKALRGGTCVARGVRITLAEMALHETNGAVLSVPGGNGATAFALAAIKTFRGWATYEQSDITLGTND